MTVHGFDKERFRKGFLLLFVFAISFLFLRMIRPFITALLLAAIFSAMLQPFYERLVAWLRGRRSTASALTVVLVLFLIVVPLLGFLGILANEAVVVSETAVPWVEEQLSEPTQIDQLIQRLPFSDTLEPYNEQIREKLGDLAGKTLSWVVASLAETGRQTAWFMFFLFVMLYSMFFFLKDGRRVLDKILFYTPLSPDDENRMVGKFVSVTRATIKGTLVIGILQGGLAGIAFAVVGIQGSLFWGTIMMVLSIIPGVGTAVIWIPAAIYLGAIGQLPAAIGLTIWCAAVVGSVDNIVRPWLVGKDTQLPDLLILLGTLGGLFLFGAVGIIIGPIIAALFVTVWDIYGSAFGELLPPVDPASEPNGEG